MKMKYSSVAGRLLVTSAKGYTPNRVGSLVVRICCSAVNARSRSAPARGYLSDGSYRTRAWPAFLEEPVEIKVYDVDDVERLARWCAQETEVLMRMLFHRG